MAENKLADISTGFTVRILEVTEEIKGHHSLFVYQKMSLFN